MCFPPIDLDRPQGHDTLAVRRLAVFLGIDVFAFIGKQHPFPDSSDKLAHQALEPDLEAALSRIDDEETRAHMAHLLTTLDTLRART